MPRTARLRLAGLPLHIVHRGNNRGACFFQEADYRRYLVKLEECVERFDCQVHAYVLMTNHVHLLVSPAVPTAISWFMKRVAQDHAQHVNRTYGRTGAVWENRYYSGFVDSESYLFTCHRYIETNPVRAGMVRHPAEYPWSSFRSNALGYPSSLVRQHCVYGGLGSTPETRQAAYRALFDAALTDHELAFIRAATRGGRAIGSIEFLERLKLQAGRSLAPAKRGRHSRQELEIGELGTVEMGTVPLF
jgi:putative transposase